MVFFFLLNSKIIFTRARIDIFRNNGGPGASSIADGFWIEHGPFRLQENAEGVNDYEWSWNKVASIIYLESPSGVGFSYSNKSSGYNCTDDKTAMENYLFLVAFFNVFTDFVDNDFYLTGECMCLCSQ